MKNKLSFLIAPAVFCWCLFYLQSCSDPAIDNVDPLGGKGLAVANDTLQLGIRTEIQKQVSSSGVSQGALGSIADPTFGNTYAGFYAQCQLTSNSVSFGDGAQLDSIVLSLKYITKYGKFTTPLNVSVYELNEDMSSTATYYSTATFGVNAPPIGKKDGFIPDLTDSVILFDQTLDPQLRIQLDPAYGKKILNADPTALTDNSSFVSLIKGIYVTTGSNITGNGLVYFDLNSIVSNIAVYYHNTTSDSLIYILPLTGVKVNHFDNIYTGTPVYTAINSPNPNTEEKFYVQAGGGLRGRILIPGLDSLAKNKAVNKAELVITIAKDSYDTTYFPPPLLDLFRIDDAGEGQHLEDEGLNSFNGVLEPETVNGVIIYRYRFNIRYFFQKLLQGIYHNNGFYLQSPQGANLYNSTSERVVLGNSSTDKNYRVSLIVTYIKL